MANQKPNFVFIMTDTQATNMVSSYCKQNVNTNNIDNLANQGAKFTSAYTTTPVCTPARASLFTGIFSQSSGAYTNSLPLGQGIRTMGHYFKEAGYDTIYIGKWHLDGHDYFGDGICPEEWDDAYWYDGKRYLDELSSKEIDLWRNGLSTLKELKDNNITADFTWARRVSNKALDFLAKKRKEQGERKPFLLVVSYDEPHHPFTCPPEYAEKYENFTYQVSKKKSNDSLEGKPIHHTYWAKSLPAPINKETGEYHHPIYFGSNDFVDDEIGSIINEAQDLDKDNTYILYTSDHGDMMGAHGMSQKGANMYDDITNIPFIIQGPNIKNIDTDIVVSHVDCIPTMLDLAGLQEKITPHFAGKSLVPVLRDSTPTQEEEFSNRGIMMEFNRFELLHDGFGGFIPIRAWVTKEYKLVINLLSDVDELYDRKNDPDEVHNVINDPAFVTIRNQMHDTLLDYMDSILDPFRTYEWATRSWRPEKRAQWINYWRPKLDNGVSPYIRDYDTGKKTVGVHLEQKVVKF